MVTDLLSDYLLEPYLAQKLVRALARDLELIADFLQGFLPSPEMQDLQILRRKFHTSSANLKF
jgi:hypothetical protein